MRNVTPGTVVKVLLSVVFASIILGLGLTSCTNLLNRGSAAAGIPTPAAPAVAQAPPAAPTATAGQPAAPAPAAAQAAAPQPTAVPAQASVIPTVQPVIVTESGEVVVVPQGGQAPRTVQEQPGISAAPLAQGPQSDVACGQRVEHVVAPGQTLFGIANYYRSTTYSVARLNRIANVRRLSVGQRLIVLTCDRAGGAAPGGAGRRYVVRAGDNLYRIGLRYGRSAEHIRAANGLPSYQISPGQILVIP